MKRIIDKTVNVDFDSFKGNAFLALEVFKRQAQKENWKKSEIDAVVKEAHRLKDYDHILATVETYCESKNEEE